MLDYIVEGVVRVPGVTVESQLIDWTFTDEIDVTRDDYLISVPAPRLRQEEQTRWRFPDKGRPYRARMFGLVSPGMPIRCSRRPGRVRVLGCRIDRQHFERSTGIERIAPEQLIAILQLDDPRFRAIFSAMGREIADPGFAAEEYIGSLSSLMLIEIARRLHAEAEGAPGGSLAGWQLRRIEEAVRSAAPDTRLTIESVASLCGLSGRHLMRGFKAATGMTLHRYIEDIRLDRAKALLRDHDLPLKVIAGTLGFASPSHLSAAFRKSTGITPTAYRTGAQAGLYH